MCKILSIIVPSYNMEAYLPKCLGSLIVDDKELLQKLDVIVVNDGSKDRTSEIAHGFETKYPGVFRVIDKANGHYGSCINAAMSVARGTYIKVLDADDSFDKIAFAALLSSLKALEVKGRYVDLILTPFIFVDANGREGEVCRCPVVSGKVLPFEDILPFASCIAMHMVAYKRENLLSMCYRQTEGVHYTDQEWIFTPMNRVNSFIYFDDLVVYRYLIGREGSSGLAAPIKMFEDWKEELSALLSQFERTHADYAHRQYLCFRVERIVSYIFGIFRTRMPYKLLSSRFDEFDELLVASKTAYDIAGKLEFSRKMKFRPVRFCREHKKLRVPYMMVFRFYYKLVRSVNKFLGES